MKPNPKTDSIKQLQEQIDFLQNELKEKAAKQKHLESELIRSNKKLIDILDSMFTFVGIYSTEGILIEANKAPIEAAGIKYEDVIGKPFEDTYWWSYSPKVKKNVKEAIQRAAQGETVRYEAPVRVAENTFITIDVAFCPLYDEEGKVFQIVGSAVDVTERNKAQATQEKLISELQRKNQDLEHYTFTVSHDLKSPLTTIKGFVNILEEKCLSGNTQEFNEFTGRILKAANTMERLLSDLMNVSRIDFIKPKREVFSLKKVINEVLNNLKGPTTQSNTEIVVASNLPDLNADRSQTLQVFQNLIENGIKFSKNNPKPKIEIGWEKDKDNHVFFVKDNGMGISPDHHEKVFRLFEKLDSEKSANNLTGTGVGLAAVKKLIERHNGEVWIDSQGDNSGTTFFFTIPEEENLNG